MINVIERAVKEVRRIRNSEANLQKETSVVARILKEGPSRTDRLEILTAAKNLSFIYAQALRDADSDAWDKFNEKLAEYDLSLAKLSDEIEKYFRVTEDELYNRQVERLMKYISTSSSPQAYSQETSNNPMSSDTFWE